MTLNYHVKLWSYKRDTKEMYWTTRTQCNCCDQSVWDLEDKDYNMYGIEVVNGHREFKHQKIFTYLCRKCIALVLNGDKKTSVSCCVCCKKTLVGKPMCKPCYDLFKSEKVSILKQLVIEDL